MRRGLALPLLLAGLAASPAAAQIQHEDPDWPCVQRLVPTLGAAAYWGGPEPAEDTGWRDDPAAAAAVAGAAPRGVDVERGEDVLRAYLAALPPDARPAAAARAMEGLTAATNEQRTVIIERLRNLTRRQRTVAARVSAISARLRSLPPDAPERPDLAAQRVFVLREFDEVQRTIMYACEVPVEMEARLGSYARALTEGQEP